MKYDCMAIMYIRTTPLATNLRGSRTPPEGIKELIMSSSSELLKAETYPVTHR